MILSDIMKRLHLILFAFITITAISYNVFAQATAGEAYNRGRRCYSDLKASQAKSSLRQEWEKCVDVFEKVNMAFPKEKKGAEALYSAGRLKREMYYKFRDKSDVEASISLYNKVIKEYPKSTLADDSLYNIAVLRHRPLGQDDRARMAVDFLLKTYPKGDMVGKAKGLKASLGTASAATKTASAPTPAEEPVVPAAAASDSEKMEVIEIKEETHSPFASDVAGPFDGALLTSIDIGDVSGGTNVDLGFNRSVAYSVEFTETGIRTKSPPKLELTLSYTKPTDALAKELSVKSDYLKAIKVKKRILGSGTKLLFKMKPGTTYELIPKGNRIAVNFRREGSSPPAKTSIVTKSAEPEALALDSKKKATNSDRSGARGEGPGGDRSEGNPGEGRSSGDIEEVSEGTQEEDRGQSLPDEE